MGERGMCSEALRKSLLNLEFLILRMGIIIPIYLTELNMYVQAF